METETSPLTLETGKVARELVRTGWMERWAWETEGHGLEGQGKETRDPSCAQGAPL